MVCAIHNNFHLENPNYIFPDQRELIRLFSRLRVSPTQIPRANYSSLSNCTCQLYPIIFDRVEILESWVSEAKYLLTIVWTDSDYMYSRRNIAFCSRAESLPRVNLSSAWWSYNEFRAGEPSARGRSSDRVICLRESLISSSTSERCLYWLSSWPNPWIFDGPSRLWVTCGSIMMLSLTQFHTQFHMIWSIINSHDRKML